MLKSSFLSLLICNLQARKKTRKRKFRRKIPSYPEEDIMTDDYTSSEEAGSDRDYCDDDSDDSIDLDGEAYDPLYHLPCKAKRKLPFDKEEDDQYEQKADLPQARTGVKAVEINPKIYRPGYRGKKRLR